ncbi:MAG: alanine--glyoxylate aminotransferase family protein [Leptospirales bacterium]
MNKKYLLAPGPVQVPSEVLLEMAKPIIHHRTEEFEHTIARVQELLQELFQTKGPVLTFASSGTGAMEAAIVNLHSQKESVLVVRNGKFSERLGAIAEAYGLDVQYIDIPYGDAVEPKAIQERLTADVNIKSVLIEYSETSTGTMNNIEEISKIVKKTDALLIVDAITALGVVSVPCEEWGIDAVIGGSQKSLMLPPGLSFLWCSKRAWARSEKSNLPKFYFNIQEELKALKKNTTAWTPAISLINGLKVALEMMQEYGWNNLYEKNRKLALAVQAGIKALGLEIFSRNSSISVCAVQVPTGVDGVLLVKKMKDEYGVTIAGGQGELKGNIFRVGTLGYIDRTDILVFFGTLEAVLKELGYLFQPGSGINAAQKVMY